MILKELEYTEDIFDLFSELADFAEKSGLAKGVVIKTEDIMVSGHVKESCVYCTSFGCNFSCPPFSPEIERTRSVIGEYDYGLLLALRVSAPSVLINLPVAGDILKKLLVLRNGRKMHRMVLELERRAKNKGYLADSFIAGKCLLHTKCKKLKGQGCEYPLFRRYSMESAGIDVFGLSKRYGIRLMNVLGDEFYYIGLFMAREKEQGSRKVQILETDIEEDTEPQRSDYRFDIDDIKHKLMRKYSEGKLIVAKNAETSRDGISLNKLAETVRKNCAVVDYGYVMLKSRNPVRSNIRKILCKLTRSKAKSCKYGVYVFLRQT